MSFIAPLERDRSGGKGRNECCFIGPWNHSLPGLVPTRPDQMRRDTPWYFCQQGHQHHLSGLAFVAAYLLCFIWFSSCVAVLRFPAALLPGTEYTIHCTQDLRCRQKFSHPHNASSSTSVPGRPFRHRPVRVVRRLDPRPRATHGWAQSRRPLPAQGGP